MTSFSWTRRKAQYIHYLPEAVRLLNQEGILLTDNVLQDGDVMESRFAVERRNRTIHARMREFLYEMKHHEGAAELLFFRWETEWL